jgi:eukaryotic-like serine/threonine-protein kinase
MTPPSEVAGRYTLERRLGAGGMSTVFLATDRVLERPVAVKLLAEHLAEDEAFVARFRREALAAARLQHPNIVQVFDSGEDAPSHRHYIVMEYVEGPSCADMLRERKRLEIEETVRVIRDACHGLDYAHRAGVVHRDVKPGNLLVASETGSTKLADFGIAKAAEQTRITQVGAVLGTAAYLSPEQARGEEAGPPSDIYSLGVCTYQFLAGRLPHEYSSLTELALKQQEEAVEPITTHRPEVPPALDQAIRLCLQRDPAARYPSTLDLAHALEAGLHGDATEATRALAVGELDPDATQALGELTAATQALRTQGTRLQPPRPAPPAPRRTEARAPERGVDRRADKRRKRRRRFGTLLTLLAVLMAGGAVALAVIAASGDDGGTSPIDAGDVRQQIDELKQFIREHAP